MFRKVSAWLRLGLALIKRADPLRIVVLGYASYILLGWLLLCIPFSRARGAGTALDHLFTATSAVSTTGLVTLSTSDDYTFFGQVVILLLIQLGGIGYMTAGSFLALAVSGDLSPFRKRIASVALNLPPGVSVGGFVGSVVAFTFLIEAAGAAGLYAVFRSHGAADPVWLAIFHSVSAFCTAGFGLFNNSFESYRGDHALNALIMALSYLGGIGFIVLIDVWRSIRRLRPTTTLTTKVILVSTIAISLVGTVVVAIDEPSVRSLPLGERWLAAWFQVMTASTTVGFNTVPIAGLSGSSLFLITIIMIIGASPSGTGGGLKTTTFSALWAVMMSTIRRRRTTTFFGRGVPEARLRSAVANVMFYCLALIAGIYALLLVEEFPLADQMFECASALGTVGLSRGITPGLTSIGKGIIIVLMFVGRIGPVVLGMSLLARDEDEPEPPVNGHEDLTV